MRTLRVMVVLAAVMTATFAAPLTAQGQGGGGRQGQMGGNPAAMQARQNERLFEGITLSAEQKAKVDSIQAAAREAPAAMQGGGMRDPEARQRMMAQRQATMTAVRAVLSAEQQATFDRNLANMPGMSAGGRPPEGQRTPPR